MQTAINLWLWRYKNPKKNAAKFHLHADEPACLLLLQSLGSPAFTKISYGLREVPESMPRILKLSDPRFISFSSLRIQKSDGDCTIWEERDGRLDMHLTSLGINTFIEATKYMLEGQWDFTMDDVSYWGLLSEAEFLKRHG